MRTHYDNLKVSHDAPDEVIKAAYRTLSRKYHPDNNNNSPESVRIMTIINISYEVISDPQKRRDYDESLKRMDSNSAFDDNRQSANNQNTTTTKRHTHYKSPSVHNRDTNKAILIAGLLIIAFLTTAGILEFGKKENPRIESKYIDPILTANNKTYENTPDSTLNVSNINKPASDSYEYKRAERAPNGSLWPNKAGYIGGYKKLRTNGLSYIVIDNKSNDSDVYVKLCYLNNNKKQIIRHAFIPAYEKFKISSVSPGVYDIRYRELATGQISKSEPFELEEIEKENGIEYSTFEITLYKVTGGNMQTYIISDEEFADDELTK